MNSRPNGKLPGGFSAALLGAAALLGLAAGCGDSAPNLLSEDGSQQSDSAPVEVEPDVVVGSWVLAGTACDQLLVLRSGGTFTLAAYLRMDGAQGIAEVQGDYALEDAPGGKGVGLKLTSVEAPEPTVPVYCDQWRQRSGIELDLAQIALEAGSEPGALTLRTELSPLLGRIVIGTDAARHDRFALVTTEEEEIEVYLLSPEVADPPFFHAHFTDASRWVETPINSQEVLPLPRTTLYGLYPGASSGQTLLKQVFNVTEAVEVSAAAVTDSALPGCKLTIYADTTYSSVVSTVALDASGDPYRFSLNPGDPDQTFETHLYTGPHGDSTAYIVPMAIEAADSGDCSIYLAARPLVVDFLEGLKADGADPAVTLPSPGPDPQRVAATPANPGRLVFEPLLPRLVQGAALLEPKVVSVLPLEPNGDGEAPYFDVLDVLHAGQDGATATLGESDGNKTLSLFGAGEPGGSLGPFEAYDRPNPVATLTPPETAQGTLEGEGDEQAFRLSLAEAGRLVLWSGGGPQVRGTLLDSHGQTLAENRYGAPDGRGFQLVRTLGAGSYDLVVRQLGEGGDYTLHTEDGADISFSDDALAACAIESGWAAGAPIEALDCRQRGVESLAGLETLPLLNRLTLGGNRIADLSPLTGLTSLRELSLYGNPITDIAPLGALPLLERLSLADTLVGADQLPQLATLAATLTHLDLSAISTITAEEAAALKPANSNLVLILPDGTVLE